MSRGQSLDVGQIRPCPKFVMITGIRLMNMEVNS